MSYFQNRYNQLGLLQAALSYGAYRSLKTKKKPIMPLRGTAYRNRLVGTRGRRKYGKGYKRRRVTRRRAVRRYTRYPRKTYARRFENSAESISRGETNSLFQMMKVQNVYRHAVTFRQQSADPNARKSPTVFVKGIRWKAYFNIPNDTGTWGNNVQPAVVRWALIQSKERAVNFTSFVTSPLLFNFFTKFSGNARVVDFADDTAVRAWDDKYLFNPISTENCHVISSGAFELHRPNASSVLGDRRYFRKWIGKWFPVKKYVEFDSGSNVQPRQPMGIIAWLYYPDKDDWPADQRLDGNAVHWSSQLTVYY